MKHFTRLILIIAIDMFLFLGEHFLQEVGVIILVASAAQRGGMVLNHLLVVVL